MTATTGQEGVDMTIIDPIDLRSDPPLDMSQVRQARADLDTILSHPAAETVLLRVEEELAVDCRNIREARNNYTWDDAQRVHRLAELLQHYTGISAQLSRQLTAKQVLGSYLEARLDCLHRFAETIRLGLDDPRDLMKHQWRGGGPTRVTVSAAGGGK